MQAIIVRYIGPSNSRGSRMKASAANLASITRAYDSKLNVQMNARQAASDLIQKLGWYPSQDPRCDNLYGAFWAMGELPNGDYVFVNHSAKPHMDMYSIDTRLWAT